MLSLEGHGFNRCSGNHASTTCIVHPEGNKKFSVTGDSVCNVHWDWATTTALLWEYIAPKIFLAKRCPNHYLVCSLQTLLYSLGVVFVGFRCISTSCLLSTFSRQHRWVMQQSLLWGRWPGGHFCLPFSGGLSHSPPLCDNLFLSGSGNLDPNVIPHPKQRL